MGLVESVPLVGLDEVGAVHFIAIGGSGMSGIAAAYADAGVRVSGSDDRDTAYLVPLRERGITVFIGHEADHLGDADTVIYSSAIPDSNVELVQARRRGLRVWHRSAGLGALMLGRRGVAVTGTHGKTTTTGMTAEMLAVIGLRPSYVIGSALSSSHKSAELGDGDVFVVEADESDASFLQYPAEVVAITNIEVDHLDNWGTAENYFQGFVQLSRQPTVRTVVLSADDAGTRRLRPLIEGGGRRVITFGESADAEVRLSQLRVDMPQASAQLTAPGDDGELRLTVPGTYNLHNAAAAYAVGLGLGLDGPTLREALRHFRGTHRRFSYVGDFNGAAIFDDYAHHPTELRELLKAARKLTGGGRLVVCFQPHMYARTQDFHREFGQALALADEAVILEHYADRDVPIPGVDGELLMADARAAGATAVTYVPDRPDAARVLAGVIRPGDLVLTAGAGDVAKVGPQVVEGRWR
ncbi:MAG: UDP-N-acetylmuramate--L-alanine ligase [Micropruina sp.]|nr:UDP-N-acetylmuramate--L-alanine ligase [Micropruina sp.]